MAIVAILLVLAASFIKPYHTRNLLNGFFGFKLTALRNDFRALTGLV